MKNVKMKATLCERQAHAGEIRKSIHASKGMERWDAWQEKRSYGHETRHVLLAYAMVRGLPYSACERKCAEGNEPWSGKIREIALEHGVELSLDDIKAWLKGEAVAQAPTAAASVAA